MGAGLNIYWTTEELGKITQAANKKYPNDDQNIKTIIKEGTLKYVEELMKDEPKI